MEQARTRPVREKAVGARPQQEYLLERVQRLGHRARIREGAEIAALVPPRAAMLHHPWKRVVVAQQNERKAFVVPQQHIIGRVKALDQLRFRSEEHTSELQSLMRISYAVFCLTKKKP